MDDETSNKWEENKLQTLVLKVSANHNVSSAEKDETIQEQDTNLGGRLGSPTKKHPYINLLGAEDKMTSNMERDIPKRNKPTTRFQS